ncbi:hypothetical protein [Streptomyces mutabilis]|uniref:hypothetical protein n=1 Tax=Streptomyces mutabilis TaxID=67332 RepID=UPI003448D163
MLALTHAVLEVDHDVYGLRGAVQDIPVRDETAEQNRYQRALTGLPGVSREPSTAGHAVF